MKVLSTHSDKKKIMCRQFPGYFFKERRTLVSYRLVRRFGDGNLTVSCYGKSTILILKVDRDNLRKENHRPFLFMNTCKSENINLNPAMCTKDHHPKNVLQVCKCGLTLENP